MLPSVPGYIAPSGSHQNSSTRPGKTGYLSQSQADKKANLREKTALLILAGCHWATRHAAGRLGPWDRMHYKQERIFYFGPE